MTVRARQEGRRRHHHQLPDSGRSAGWLIGSVEGVRLQRLWATTDDGLARRAAVGAEERGRLRRRPRRVTIFGESAGAFLVSGLVGSPEGKGLFHRAIAEERRWMGMGMGKMRTLADAQEARLRRPWPRWASRRSRISG